MSDPELPNFPDLPDNPAAPPPLPTPNASRSAWLTSPQVIAALITGVGSLIIALIGILPELLKSDALPPTATPTALAALITSLTPTPQILPSATSTPQSVDSSAVVPVVLTATPNQPAPTPLPVLTIPPTPDAAAEPNLRLFFDNISFTVQNLGGGRKSLAGLTFSSPSGRWDSEDWGRIHQNLTNRDCLRLREVNTPQQEPPSECRDLLALLLVGPEVIFWRDDAGFSVEFNGNPLATCTESPCNIALP